MYIQKYYFEFILTIYLKWFIITINWYIIIYYSTPQLYIYAGLTQPKKKHSQN